MTKSKLTSPQRSLRLTYHWPMATIVLSALLTLSGCAAQMAFLPSEKPGTVSAAQSESESSETSLEAADWNAFASASFDTQAAENEVTEIEGNKGAPGLVRMSNSPHIDSSVRRAVLTQELSDKQSSVSIIPLSHRMISADQGGNPFTPRRDANRSGFRTNVASRSLSRRVPCGRW